VDIRTKINSVDVGQRSLEHGGGKILCMAGVGIDIGIKS
jgi:hypothetical protein